MEARQYSPFVTIEDAKRRYPVDMEGLARQLGLEVFELSMPKEMSGRLLKTQTGYRIHVNAAHGRNRKRFTMAHEIAHFMLHRDLFDQQIVDDEMYQSEQITSRLESQANAYAAELLMPELRLTARYLELKDAHRPTEIVEQMALEFQVSRHAMRIRLESVVDFQDPLNP